MLIAQNWNKLRRAAKKPMGINSFQLFVIWFNFPDDLYINNGNSINANSALEVTAQKIGEEFSTPILSMLEVMLHITATNSINLTPFSLNNA